MKAIRIRFPEFVLTMGALALTQLPLDGADYYTNWAAAHFSDIPAQSGPLSDPDQDGELNVVEFAFGTDPRAPGGIAGAVQPISGGRDGTNVAFAAEILEREGHQPGAQIDLYLSADLENWFRPWWLRTVTDSQPSDPAGSIRELFITQMPGTNAWFVRSAVQLIEGGAEAANYYVATNGSDSNPGTNIAEPFATLGKAAGLAVAGNLVYLRGGTYTVSSKISLKQIATAARPIRIRAYPGENPVLDCSGEGTGTDGISISGNYYQLHGLVITNAGHNSIVISGSNNIVELCVSLGARNTGFHITGGNGGTATPSSNLFLNCDSIRSYDPPVGGNADGFTAKWSLGPGNVFSGCRLGEFRRQLGFVDGHPAGADHQLLGVSRGHKCLGSEQHAVQRQRQRLQARWQWHGHAAPAGELPVFRQFGVGGGSKQQCRRPDGGSKHGLEQRRWRHQPEPSGFPIRNPPKQPCRAQQRRHRCRRHRRHGHLSRHPAVQHLAGAAGREHQRFPEH